MLEGTYPTAVHALIKMADSSNNPELCIFTVKNIDGKRAIWTCLVETCLTEQMSKHDRSERQTCYSYIILFHKGKASVNFAQLYLCSFPPHGILISPTKINEARKN